MSKWTKAANVRLTQIQAAEGAAADMQDIAADIGKLPQGQLKKVLTQDIVDILAKYGVVIS